MTIEEIMKSPIITKGECGLGLEIHGLSNANTPQEQLKAIEDHMRVISGLYDETFNRLSNISFYLRLHCEEIDKEKTKQ